MRSRIPSAGLILALLAPVLAYSQPQTTPAPLPPAACGIAAWTGTCACSLSAPAFAGIAGTTTGGVVPFPRYAALLRSAAGAKAEAALRDERRSCRLPDGTGSRQPPPGA